MHFLNSHASQFPVEMQVKRLATVNDMMSMTHGTVRNGKHWQSGEKLKLVPNGPFKKNPSSTSK